MKILIYQSGTVVPIQKIRECDFLIKKVPYGLSEASDAVYGEGTYVVLKGRPSESGFIGHQSLLQNYLADITKDESNFDIETLPTAQDSAPKVSEFEIFIRDPKVVWYGPHSCPVCHKSVVKSSIESGGIMLDYSHENNYPNCKWTQHVCR